MTEETKQLPVISYKGKEYKQEDLTETQSYLFAQILDVQKKEQQAKFTLDQILAMKQVFEAQLQGELNKTDE